MSDHFPQFIIVENCTINYKSCSFAKRGYSNFNEDNFVDDYSSLDLSMLHDDNVSVDNKFDTFYENLSSLVDKHAPVRKMTRKEVRLHAKPWINQKIIKPIKYRDKLKRKMKRKPPWQKIPPGSCRILYFIGSYTGSWQDPSRITLSREVDRILYRILTGCYLGARLVGSYIREAKLVRSCIGSYQQGKLAGSCTTILQK